MAAHGTYDTVDVDAMRQHRPNMFLRTERAILAAKLKHPEAHSPVHAAGGMLASIRESLQSTDPTIVGEHVAEVCNPCVVAIMCVCGYRMV